MTNQDLVDFRVRCVAAQTYGRTVANAAAYVDELEKEAGPVPVPPGVPRCSAAHLIALIDKTLKVRSGAEKKVAAPKPPDPKPKAKAPAKAPAKPKAKAPAKPKAKAPAKPKAKAKPVAKAKTTKKVAAKPKKR